MSTNSRPIISDYITFAIVALNEEKRIVGAIDSIKRISECSVVVYDGGSTDQTAELANKLGAIVKCLPGSSIELRRRAALVECNTPYICFLDADQIFHPSTDFCDVLACFDINNSLAGVQFRLKALADSPSYWANGFSLRHNLITGQAGPRTVIGTPCVFKVEFLLKTSYIDGITGPSDDTMACHRLRENGYTLEAITETACEYVRANSKSTIKKAFWYGRGDAEYLRRLKSGPSILNHFLHVVIREPFIRPGLVLLRSPFYFPFMILFGFARLVGFIQGMLLPRDLSLDAS